MKPLKHICLAALIATACSAEPTPISGEGRDRDSDRATDEDSSGSGGSQNNNNNNSNRGKDAGSGSRGGSSNTKGDDEDETCESHDVASRKTTPDMLIVLDRSGSMSPNGNTSRTDRWSGSVDAVLEVTNEFSSQINFGLMTFPAFTPSATPPSNDPLGGILGGILGGAGGFAQACATGTVNVEIGKDKAGEISTALMGITPGGATPTAASLEAAQQALGSGLAQADGIVPPKYVLLLTDGDPNCSQDFQSGRGGAGGGFDTNARGATIKAIEKLRDDGIQTYVVGYQTAGTNFAQQLDMMAAAGGTGDKMHRSVSSPGDLTATFSEIAGRALSCSFKLDKPVVDPSFVRVTLQGKTVQYDNAENGWSLGQDKQTVTLTGAACDMVQEGAVFSVTVECERVFVQ